MVKLAVLSAWTPIQDTSNSMGFTCYKDYLFSQAFALIRAKELFPKVKFLTNDFIYSQFKKVGLDILVSEFDLSLNQFNKTLNKLFWGYVKSYCYTQQGSENFVHQDNDFFFIDFNNKFHDCKIGFQSPEIFDDKFYCYYYQLIRMHKESPFPLQTILDNPTDRGQNCGMVVCNGQQDLFHEAFELATYYNTKNKDFLFSYLPDYKPHLNLFSEQYILSSLVKKYNLEPEYLFIDNPRDALKLGNRFVHTWGAEKLKVETVAKIKNRVIDSHPEIAEKIDFYFK